LTLVSTEGHFMIVHAVPPNSPGKGPWYRDVPAQSTPSGISIRHS